MVKLFKDIQFCEGVEWFGLYRCSSFIREVQNPYNGTEVDDCKFANMDINVTWPKILIN